MKNDSLFRYTFAFKTLLYVVVDSCSSLLFTFFVEIDANIMKMKTIKNTLVYGMLEFYMLAVIYSCNIK